MVKNPPANAEDVRDAFDPWVKKIPLEEGMATHYIILAWRIPWTKEPGGLQSMESQRVGSDLACTDTETISFRIKFLTWKNLLRVRIPHMK